MTHESIDGAQLIKSMDELASPLHALAMVLEERRQEIMDDIRGRTAETLFCTTCQAKVKGIADAVRAGWSCIIDDEGDEQGNFAGHCGACTEDIENEPDKPKKSATLFPDIE